MKKPLALIFSFLVATPILRAIETKPKLGTFKHNEAERTCLEINLESSVDETMDAWITFMKKNYDVKLSGTGWFNTGSLLKAEKVIIPQISENEMDFYTNVEENAEGNTRMQVFVAFGYDLYVNRKEFPNEFAQTKLIFQEFLNQHLKSFYHNEVTKSEEMVKDLRKTVTKKEKSYAKKEKKIEQLNQELEALKKEEKELQEKMEAAANALKENEKKLNEVLNKVE